MQSFFGFIFWFFVVEKRIYYKLIPFILILLLCFLGVFSAVFKSQFLLFFNDFFLVKSLAFNALFFMFDIVSIIPFPKLDKNQNR